MQFQNNKRKKAYSFNRLKCMLRKIIISFMSIFLMSSILYANEDTKALEMINEARAANHLPILQYSNVLEEAAQNHANYLTYNQLQDHAELTDLPFFTGINPWERVIFVNGYPYQAVAETISSTNLPNESWEQGTDNLFSSIYHRFVFFHKSLYQIGYASAEETVEGKKYKDTRYVFVVGSTYSENLCLQCEAHLKLFEDFYNLCKSTVNGLFNTISVSEDLYKRYESTVTDLFNKIPGSEDLYKRCKSTISDLFNAIPVSNDYTLMGYTIIEASCNLYCETALSTLFNKERVNNDRILKKQPIILYPWPNQQDFYPEFIDNEYPDPTPFFGLTGNPISIQFSPSIFRHIEIISFSLTDAHGKQLETWELNNQTDVNKLFSPFDFAWFPLQPLQWDSQYSVQLKYRADGGEITEKKWSFKTKIKKSQ